jgi:hypothetical protein
MKTQYLQDFVDKTRHYRTSLFCLAASCCYLLGGQPQDVNAATQNQKVKRSPEEIKQLLSDINEKMKSCNSQSLLDRLTEKSQALENQLFSGAKSAVLFAGTDTCPGTNIPAGTSFSDTGTTAGANNTVTTVNTGCIVGQSGFYTTAAGPDHIYKFVFPAVGSRTASCTISVTTTGTYDGDIYYLSVGGGGCPNGTANTVTNCIKGQDQVFGIGTETITDAQTDATPAGTYFLFIDSFYSSSVGSGAYTLNFNCTTLSPTAAIVGVGGRVTTANGRPISKARVSVVLPSGESRFTYTNPFGYYRFDDIEVGQAYVFQVSSKANQFSNPSQLITVNDNIEDLNFTADAESSKPQR